MLKTAYFYIFLTIVAYYIGLKLAKKFKNTLVNPMLIAMFICCGAVFLMGVSYDEYMTGGRFISIFMGPSTVALVVPLYKNINIVKKNFLPILVGVFVGSLTAVISVFILAKLLGLSDIIKISLLPQSITTAIALPLSEKMKGIGAITIIAVMIRGIIGAILAPIIFKILKIQSPVAKGIAIGTTSHVVGTSKAIEMGEIEGAMSGLSIAIAGILTSIYMSFF